MPERSPEREALAQAIERREAARAELERAKAAYGRIDLYGGLMHATERAEERLKAARERAPHRFVDRLMGVTVADEVEVAEQELAAAQRSEAEGRAAARQLEEAVIPELQTAVERAGGQVKAVAAAVLRPLVEPAIEALEKALHAVVAAGDKLLWLRGQGVVQIRQAPPGGTAQDVGSSKRGRGGRSNISTCCRATGRRSCGNCTPRRGEPRIGKRRSRRCKTTLTRRCRWNKLEFLQ
jgi:hypothetical protein